MIKQIKLCVAGLILIISTQSVLASNEIRCMAISEVASAIMRARQSGAPMEKMIAIAKNSNLHKSLVKLAYTTPKYDDKDRQKGSIEGFKIGAFFQCMETNQQ